MDKNKFEQLNPYIEKNDEMKTLTGYSPVVLYEDACAKAKEQGKIIVVSEPTLLMIDIDSSEAFLEYLTRLPTVEDHIEYVTEQMVTSFSGGSHRHIYIRMKSRMSVREQCAIQLYLCSDPVKEMLSLILEKKGDEHPILFFEKLDFTLDI
ncbi:hypothetical protein LCGC14_1185800 [marine sediment metagenome]|uniref:Uncharacterized protein n=1 Tax=marine sediment metagenome TaxID=412755 RepID=A0A0F9PR94_9ZZZZ